MIKKQGHDDVEAIRRFLRNEFRISTKLSVLRDQVQTSTELLSDGLATWVLRIQAPSRTIRIQATAGGLPEKRKLAMRLLEDAVAKQERCLYVCFNRTLADYMARIVSPKADVYNYHDMCVEHYRRKYGDPDFSEPTVLQQVVDGYASDCEHFVPKYDLLLIDEGQDFEPGWVETLLPQLKDEGRLYLLEDLRISSCTNGTDLICRMRWQSHVSIIFGRPKPSVRL